MSETSSDQGSGVLQLLAVLDLTLLIPTSSEVKIETKEVKK